MTLQTLQVINEDGRSMEVYINEASEIFFGEVGHEEDPSKSWMCFSKEDWEAIKAFVDEQLKPF